MKVLCILLCVAFASSVYIDSNEIHENKIFGGNRVKIEDVPYQASLLRNWMSRGHICGATIIHKSWIITAAHCVENRVHVSVRIGTEKRNKIFGKVYQSEKIIRHEAYIDTFSGNNDIALIKLTKPIKFNSKQQPIALAKPHEIPREGEWMQISGFGRIGQNLEFSDILKAAQVRVISQENCERAYESREPITDKMFCAGIGEADTCEGDSGGPGVIHGKLYGITSSGEYCETKIYPGVYTRVHKYYDWIVEKTGLRL